MIDILRSASRLALTSTALIGLTVSGVSAQGVTVSIPSEDPAQGFCNFFPFGSSGSALADQKYQMVLRSADLPQQAGVLTAVRFSPCGSGLRTFSTIRIVAAVLPAGTTLSTTFADNLNDSARVIFDESDFEWANTADTWNGLPLSSGLQYEAGGDLLLDIELTGASISNFTSGFHRASNIDRVGAQFVGGSAPATAEFQDSFGLRVQLEFGGPAVLHRIELDGCQASNGQVPQLGFGGAVLRRSVAGSEGFEVEWRLTGAPTDGPINFGVLLLSATTPSSPILFPGGTDGCSALVGLTTLIAVLPAPVDQFGRASVSFSENSPLGLLPGDVGFGLELFSQWVATDARTSNFFGLVSSARGVSVVSGQ